MCKALPSTNTVAGGACWSALATLVASPPRKEEGGFAHSLQQARGWKLHRSFHGLPHHHTQRGVSVKGSVSCLALDIFSEVKSDLERGSFQILIVTWVKTSSLQYRGGFWAGAWYIAPLLCQPLSSLAHLWVLLLCKDPQDGHAAVGTGGYRQLSYRNHNTNCGSYNALH